MSHRLCPPRVARLWPAPPWNRCCGPASSTARSRPRAPTSPPEPGRAVRRRRRSTPISTAGCRPGSCPRWWGRSRRGAPRWCGDGWRRPPAGATRWRWSTRSTGSIRRRRRPAASISIGCCGFAARPSPRPRARWIRCGCPGVRTVDGPGHHGRAHGRPRAQGAQPGAAVGRVPGGGDRHGRCAAVGAAPHSVHHLAARAAGHRRQRHHVRAARRPSRWRAAPAASRSPCRRRAARHAGAASAAAGRRAGGRRLGHDARGLAGRGPRARRFDGLRFDVRVASSRRQVAGRVVAVGRAARRSALGRAVTGGLAPCSPRSIRWPRRSTRSRAWRSLLAARRGRGPARAVRSRRRGAPLRRRPRRRRSPAPRAGGCRRRAPGRGAHAHGRVAAGAGASGRERGGARRPRPARRWRRCRWPRWRRGTTTHAGAAGGRVPAGERHRLGLGPSARHPPGPADPPAGARPGAHEPRGSRRADDAARVRASQALDVLRRWGIRTLGQFAALPAAELSSRLGPLGPRWQHAARGDDMAPLVPLVADEPFEASLELEWPVEGLEPLSFVLGRVLEPLAVRLERADRGAAVLHTELHLTTRERHTRTLQLPAPMRDPKTLRTLILLDLESHPPAGGHRPRGGARRAHARPHRAVVAARTRAAVDRAGLHAHRAPQRAHGRIARGLAALVDSWRPGAFAMTPFGQGLGARGSGHGTAAAASGWTRLRVDAGREHDSETLRSTRPASTPQPRDPSPEPRAPVLWLSAASACPCRPASRCKTAGPSASRPTAAASAAAPSSTAPAPGARRVTGGTSPPAERPASTRAHSLGSRRMGRGARRRRLLPRLPRTGSGAVVRGGNV